MINIISKLPKIIFFYMVILPLLIIYAAENYLHFLKSLSIKPNIEELRYAFIGLLVTTILLFFHDRINKVRKVLTGKHKDYDQALSVKNIKHEDKTLKLNDSNVNLQELKLIKEIILDAHDIQINITNLQISHNDKIDLFEKLNTCMKSLVKDAIELFIKDYKEKNLNKICLEANSSEIYDDKTKNEISKIKNKIFKITEKIKNISQEAKDFYSNLETYIDNALISIKSEQKVVYNTFTKLEKGIKNSDISDDLKCKLLSKLYSSMGNLIEQNIDYVDTQETTSSVEPIQELDQFYKGLPQIKKFHQEIQQLSQDVEKIENDIDELFTIANELQLNDDKKRDIVDSLLDIYDYDSEHVCDKTGSSDHETSTFVPRL